MTERLTDDLYERMWASMDRIRDMDTTMEDYARAAADEVRAELERVAPADASQTGAPDRIWAWCFQTNEHGGWKDWGGYARPDNLFPMGDREKATGAVYVREDLCAPADDLRESPERALADKILAEFYKFIK